MAEKAESKIRVFFIAKKDKEIFDFLKNNKKKIETRAATVRNSYAKTGDIALFICDKKRLKKKIAKVTHYKTIDALLRKYRPSLINPSVSKVAELKEMYYSFPGYKEKIKKFGILALELL